uniref:Uncharacterized protein n=1 Tax=Magallana gigas TaxID=29159 RepID=A0A8W8LBX4_MAGGI
MPKTRLRIPKTVTYSSELTQEIHRLNNVLQQERPVGVPLRQRSMDDQLLISRQSSCDDHMVMTRQYSFDEQRPLLSRQESSDDHRVPSLSNIQKVPSISDLTDDALAFLYERDVQRVPDVFSAALEAIGVCLLDVELEG